MKIVFATDHAGFELKEELKRAIGELGYEVEDYGAYESNPEDDYPEFIAQAAQAVSKDPEHCWGVVLGASGQGEAIVANRFPNVRAIVYAGPLSGTQGHELLRLSREHNNANVLALGARFLTFEEAQKALELWLSTPFSNEERHDRRIQKIETLNN